MSTEARRIGTDFYIFILVADIYVPGTHMAHRIYLYQVKKYPLGYSCTKFRGSLGRLSTLLAIAIYQVVSTRN